jgi:type IV secretion system protein VirB1
MACAPNVHPTTINAIAKAESEYKHLAVNINTRKGIKLRPKIKITKPSDAIAVTYAAMSLGHTVDMGYMQVNSANLKRLGYTVEDMFDPCKNINAGGKIFTEAYITMLAIYKDEQIALSRALSIYNTGNPQDGFSNGYVSRYYKQ